MLLVKRGQFFLYLFSVKIRLEIVLTDFVDKNETFLTIKSECFKVLKIAFFSKGLTHAFG